MENLRREGVNKEKIHLVGNVMIDTLLDEIKKIEIPLYLEKWGLQPKRYGLVTLHRPSNVDDPKILGHLLQLFLELSEEIPMIFPIHPRTRQAIRRFGLDKNIFSSNRFFVVNPISYGKTSP